MNSATCEICDDTGTAFGKRCEHKQELEPRTAMSPQEQIQMLRDALMEIKLNTHWDDWAHVKAERTLADFAALAATSTPPAQVSEHAELRRLAEVASNCKSTMGATWRRFESAASPVVIGALLDELASLRASAVAAKGNALGMLKYALPYIHPRAIDMDLARKGPMADAFVNTIVRRFIEGLDTAPTTSEVPGEAALSDGEAHSLLTNMKEHIEKWCVENSVEDDDALQHPQLAGECIRFIRSALTKKG